VYINTNVVFRSNDPSATQTLYANSPSDWWVVANMTAGNTGVVSGPQVRLDIPGAPSPLSNFHFIYATSSENQHPNSGTSAEFGYDVWTGTSSSALFAQEMMIWTDTINRGTCGGATPVASNVQFGGSNGVPVQSWNLCVNGPLTHTSEFIWYLPTNEQSGSVDILGMVQWMVSHGYYPSNTGLSQIDQTFEICSTGGQDEVFQVTGLSIISG
jgi:hypothetical protein